MPYLSASAVVIHYEEVLYQVYGPLPLVMIRALCICHSVATYDTLALCECSSGLIDRCSTAAVYWRRVAVFNVGEYRRRVVTNFTNSVQFFHPDNIEANAIRESVSVLCVFVPLM